MSQFDSSILMFLPSARIIFIYNQDEALRFRLLSNQDEALRFRSLGNERRQENLFGGICFSRGPAPLAKMSFVSSV
jgi:hypothetical protein